MRRPSLRTSVHLVLLLAILVGAGAHNLVMSHWYVEDAAIDFAYAKHLVDGYGFVPTPGGEVVEGYSNPTWLALLAVFQLFGADLFVATHWIGFVLSLATVIAVWFAGRESAGEDSDLPLFAPAFLAANSQFAIWGTGGLENPLWNLLVALGLWRMAVELRETEKDRFRYPWSSVVWLLLSLTRPEGILYAALAGFVHLCVTWYRKRTLLPTLLWLLTFFLPWGLYQVWHYQTFAWPFANTFYAKVDRKEQAPFAWNKRSWNWSRSFFMDVGQGFFLPIWLLGVIGHEGWRLVAALLAFATCGLVTELSDDQRWLLPVIVGVVWVGFWMGLKRTEERPPTWLVGAGTVAALALVGVAELLRFYDMKPNTFPVPDLARTLPPYVLVAGAVVFPMLGVGARGWSARLPAWLFSCAAVGFAVYSQGDWMKGYRWYAMATVPGAFLFAWGTWSFARMVEDMLGWRQGDDRADAVPRLTPQGLALSALILALQLPGNIKQTMKVAEAPDPSPRGILPRVEYVRQIAARLHYDEPIADADVDMGAHLYWSDFRMLDIAGLVDVSFAHQRFEKPFVREYLFEEVKPLYIHIHGGWATNSKIPTHAEFRRDYFEVPGFPAGKNFHIGNFIRKDELVKPAWPHGSPPIRLQDDLMLFAPFVPADPGSGKRVYVEVGMSRSTPMTQRSKNQDEFRVVLFASNGTQVQSWELPPGYDWYWPKDWTPTDVFHGKYTLKLSELPPGTWDLGYVVLREDGTVLAPLAAEEAGPLPDGVIVGGVGDVPAVFARGEVRFPGALTVLSVEERGERCTAERDRALSEAAALRCEAAEEAWRLARWHRAGEKDWVKEHGPRVTAALSSCWAKSSDGQPQDERVRRLQRADRWDFDGADFVARAVPLAAELNRQGMTAREASDWELAYDLFSAAASLDGTDTWARRYAEEARGHRLGIDPETLAAKEAEEQAKAEALRKERNAPRAKKGVRLNPDGTFDRPATLGGPLAPQVGPSEDELPEDASPEDGPPEDALPGEGEPEAP